MATKCILTKQHAVIVMSRSETVNLIGLLAAQLGQTTLQGNMSGAAPDILITDKGVITQRLSFVIEEKV